MTLKYALREGFIDIRHGSELISGKQDFSVVVNNTKEFIAMSTPVGVVVGPAGGVQSGGKIIDYDMVSEYSVPSEVLNNVQPLTADEIKILQE